MVKANTGGKTTQKVQNQAQGKANTQALKDEGNTQKEAQRQAVQANVRINGGEPVDGFSDEGRAKLKETIEGWKEGEPKPRFSINDGTEYDHDAPELEAEMQRLQELHDAAVPFKALDNETQANAKKASKTDTKPNDAKIKAAMDSTTATDEDGNTRKKYTPDNPNEQFTEHNAEKAAERSAGAIAEGAYADLEPVEALNAAVTDLLTFGQPLAQALHGKPAVATSWQNAVKNAQEAQARYLAKKK